MKSSTRIKRTGIVGVAIAAGCLLAACSSVNTGNTDKVGSNQSAVATCSCDRTDANEADQRGLRPDSLRRRQQYLSLQ